MEKNQENMEILCCLVFLNLQNLPMAEENTLILVDMEKMRLYDDTKGHNFLEAEKNFRYSESSSFRPYILD